MEGLTTFDKRDQNDLFYPFPTYRGTNITNRETCYSTCAGVMANYQEEVTIAATVRSTECGSPNPPHTYMMFDASSPIRLPAVIYKGQNSCSQSG